MRYQLLVLEALPRSVGVEVLMSTLPPCVSSCAMALCRMHPFAGPTVVAASEDEPEIRAAAVRLEAARCVVCVVDRGPQLRDVVERVARQSVRPLPAAVTTLPKAAWRRVGLVTTAAVALLLVAWAGVALRARREAVVQGASVAVSPGVVPAGRVRVAAARGPLGQLLVRMAAPSEQSAQAPTRSYGAWLQQFRARLGVASSPMPSAAAEGAAVQGASPRRRPRRHARWSRLAPLPVEMGMRGSA